MKKFIISLFISIVALCGISVALDIPVTELSSLASCNPNETDNVNYYLTNNGYSRNPYDTFRNTVDSLIGGGNNGSSINIWRHGVISNCNIWNRVSNVVDGDDQNGALVFLNTDNCIFNIPNYTKTSNPTAIDAQIHYTIGYRLVFDGGSNTITDKFYYRDYGVNNWTCYPNGNTVSDLNSCSGVTLKYGSQKYHTGECLNYRVFWCGDGLVNSPYGTTYRNTSYVEACDPNDPTHAGWNNNGKTCNPTTCQLENIAPTHYCGDGIINQESEDCDPGSGNFGNGCNSNCKLMTPSCTLTVNPNQGNVPLTTTISGTTNSRWGRITKIYFGDGESYTINNWNPILPVNHTYNTIGTFYLTGVVTNVYNGQIRTGAIRPVAYCSINVITMTPPPTPYCGDGILQSNEQCDPGSGNFGNGCNENCQLMTPTCTLTVNPSQGNIPLTTTINGTKPSWATYLNLNFGDNSPLQNNPVFTLTHTYNTTGTFNLTLTVQNNYNGQINGTKPTATCSTNVTTTQPGSPVPYLLKQQKTGSMSNFTSNQINVQIGETITYKVNFGNSGTVAATGEVWDILPPCVNYLTSSIHLPNGVTYNGPITTPYLDQTMVKYKDFRLQPGQGGYMLIQAQIRGTGAHGTTSCQNITSYLNTGYFKFIGGNTLSSQVIAVRPQAPQLPHLTIVKELLTTGNVSVGDYVGYKITLRNIGSGMAYNAYILDTMPRALQYISSNIQGVTNYLFSGWMDTNGQYNVKYYNFNLAPNQSAVVYLTGRLLDGYSFGDLTNCASTSGAVDCVIISGSPVPYLLKQQKTGSMSNFTSNQINVQIGETITYKVNFGNSGTVAATGEVWDTLPPCVNYLTSSIHLPNGVTYNGPITTPYLDQTMVKYKDFRLQPGQGGYMLIQAQIRGTGAHGTTSCQNITSYLNTGYFKFVGGNTLSSQVIAVRPESSSNVIFDKTGNKNLMYPGETGLEFYITVTNQGPNPISNIYVDDIWPDNETCIIYDGWTGTKLEEVSHLRRHYIGGDAGLNQGTLNGRVSDKGGADDGKTNVGNGGGAGTNSQQTSNGILYAGQSFNFTIFAHVADNPSCVGSYVNTGKLTYTEGGSSHVLYDDYPFQVITTPNIKVSIVKTVDHQYVNHNDTVIYTIIYTNNGTAPLTNYVIKDYWPAMVEFISSTPYTNDIVVDGNGTLITWHFSTPLGVGESATITAVGRVR